MPVPTHSVAGGKGSEGWKGGLVKRMVVDVNTRKVGTIRGGGDMPSQCHWPTDGQQSRLHLGSVHMYVCALQYVTYPIMYLLLSLIHEFSYDN